MDINDIKQIVALIDTKLSVRLEKLNEEIELNASKRQSELFNLIDSYAKEIRDEREFRTISSSQTASNARRIGKLEHKVFGKTDSEA